MRTTFDMLPEEEKEAFTNEADEALKKRAKDQEEWEKNYGQLVKDRAAEAATAKAAKTTAAAGESNAKSWKDADWVPVDGRTSFVRDSSDESTHTSMVKRRIRSTPHLVKYVSSTRGRQLRGLPIFWGMGERMRLWL